jgi:hypothetical protein
MPQLGPTALTPLLQWPRHAAAPIGASSLETGSYAWLPNRDSVSYSALQRGQVVKPALAGKLSVRPRASRIAHKLRIFVDPGSGACRAAAAADAEPVPERSLDLVAQVHEAAAGCRLGGRSGSRRRSLHLALVPLLRGTDRCGHGGQTDQHGGTTTPSRWPSCAPMPSCSSDAVNAQDRM